MASNYILLDIPFAIGELGQKKIEKILDAFTEYKVNAPDEEEQEAEECLYLANSDNDKHLVVLADTIQFGNKKNPFSSNAFDEELEAIKKLREVLLLDERFNGCGFKFRKNRSSEPAEFSSLRLVSSSFLARYEDLGLIKGASTRLFIEGTEWERMQFSFNPEPPEFKQNYFVLEGRSSKNFNVDELKEYLNASLQKLEKMTARFEEFGPVDVISQPDMPKPAL